MTTFKVRNEYAEKALKELGEELKKKVPEGMGFTLMLFDYGGGGNMFYISTANRKNMVEAMKEFIKNNEE